MTHIISREIRLVSRPRGLPTPENFTLAQTRLPPLSDQQVLVQNRYLSVDPYMRGRMNEANPMHQGSSWGSPSPVAPSAK